MADLTQQIDGTSFIYPAFKFLREEHAEALLQRGNFHLSTLYEFRDVDRYKGQILDIDEGRVRLTCEYSFYDGLAKDANGILPLHAYPFQRVTAANLSLTECIDSGDALIYCTTRFVLSDSLLWALGEGKQSCVLVTDVDSMLQHVSLDLAPLSYQFLGVEECRYMGRNITDLNPNATSVSNFLLTDPRRVLYIKPTEYAHQRELRAVWIAHGNNVLAPVNRNIESLRRLCIPVNFSQVNADILRNPPEGMAIGGRINRKSGEPSAEFDIQQPWDVFSPIIYSSEGAEKMLGFYYVGNSNEFRNGNVRNCDVGIFQSQIGLIFCSIPLSDVDSIEFFHR